MYPIVNAFWELLKGNITYEDKTIPIVKRLKSKDKTPCITLDIASDMQINRDYQWDAIKLNQRLREEYPSIEKLLNLGRSMVNNSVGNNTIYDVVSAIIAELNADKYGIYVDVLLKHEVINDMKEFIEKVDKCKNSSGIVDYNSL